MFLRLFVLIFYRADLNQPRSLHLIRDRNDPKAGLASPKHTSNLSGLVLGFTKADFLQLNNHFPAFSRCIRSAGFCRKVRMCTADESPLDGDKLRCASIHEELDDTVYH